MATEDSAQGPKTETARPKAGEAHPELALPPPLREALEKVPDQQARATLTVALSRTTFGFGPDPETAKLLADAEIHEEECRLKAYQASLENRDRQAQRDHEFRWKKLNHQSAMTGVTMLVIVCGLGVGFWLSASGNSAIGNPVLAGSFAMLSILAGRLLASRE